MKSFLLLIVFSYMYSYADNLKIDILYLNQIIKKPPALSNIIEEPKDNGIKGIELAIRDSNKTAKFHNQEYKLKQVSSKNIDELLKSFEQFVNKKGVYVIFSGDDEFFKKITTHGLNKKVLLINSSNQNSNFRKSVCQKNVLHTIASDAMLYDALGQFLIKRNWKKWLLLKGSHKEDEKIVIAIKRAAKRYGAKIVEEKTWTFNSDIRRRAQSEMPSFTQSKEHDVVLTADYFGDFDEYVYFNTWLPRPVAGTSGLTPVTWHKVNEAWGAAQLQSRFEKFASRWMTSKDYATWVALRTVVTSISKTKTTNLKTNIDFIYSDKFDLAAYKGRKLSFREFNGQLRQPISIIHPKALVSSSPQDGFLHQKTDLDTLGIASYELECK